MSLFNRHGSDNSYIDPLANKKNFDNNYDNLVEDELLIIENKFDIIILGVDHSQFSSLSFTDIYKMFKTNNKKILIDIPYKYDNNELKDYELTTIVFIK